MTLSYQDIPQFPRAAYSVNVGWEYLEHHIATNTEIGLNLNPEFQREHVWTEEQQRRYVEYCLRGGETSRTLLFNCPNWATASTSEDYVIVDGKQRLEAVRKFMRNELKVFGEYREGFTGRLRITSADFIWKVTALQSPQEVLQMYLDINTAGTPHTEAEIEKVRLMMEKLRSSKDELPKLDRGLSKGELALLKRVIKANHAGIWIANSSKLAQHLAEIGFITARSEGGKVVLKPTSAGRDYLDNQR